MRSYVPYYTKSKVLRFSFKDLIQFCIIIAQAWLSHPEVAAALHVNMSAGSHNFRYDSTEKDLRPQYPKFVDHGLRIMIYSGNSYLHSFIKITRLSFMSALVDCICQYSRCVCVLPLYISFPFLDPLDIIVYHIRMVKFVIGLSLLNLFIFLLLLLVEN